jgi:DNA (cytosine-5)-methyltransferase 1
MAGAIERIRPVWILAENVPGIIRMELDTVLSDLERLDYTAWPVVVPAVGVDAPHRRDRVWIVGYTERSRCDWDARRRARQKSAHGRTNVADTDNPRRTQQRRDIADGKKYASAERGCRWQPEPELGRVAYGIPKRVDRLRGLGNAIVPQVAYQLIRMMVEAEQT